MDISGSNNDFMSKLVIITSFLILFGFLSFFIKKFSNKISLTNINNKNKLVKLVEKINITQSNSLLLVEINNQTLLLSSSNNGINIIKEITKPTSNEI